MLAYSPCLDRCPAEGIGGKCSGEGTGMPLPANSDLSETLTHLGRHVWGVLRGKHVSYNGSNGQRLARSFPQGHWVDGKMAGENRAMQSIQDYYIAPGAVVTGDVVLSSGVNVWFATVVRGDLARITLGPRVNLQDGCVVHTDYDQPLNIEEGVVVGHAAVVHGKRVG